MNEVEMMVMAVGEVVGDIFLLFFSFYQLFFVTLQPRQTSSRVKDCNSGVMGGSYLLLVLGYERGNWLDYTVRVRQ